MSDKVVVRSSGGGIGFCGALAILFIALKLLNQITWSWWWGTFSAMASYMYCNCCDSGRVWSHVYCRK